MYRFAIGALVLLGACWGSTTWAAGWSFSLDVPLTYEYNDVHVVTNSGGSNGNAVLWKNAVTSDVDGIIATLITPLHIGPVNFGLGYENYSVKGTIAAGTDASGNEVDVTIKSKFEIFDLVLDLPTELFNIDLGYGSGTAKSQITFPASVMSGGNNNPPTVPDAGVSQYFLSLGVPIKRFDFHFSWHWVSVDQVTLQQQNGNNNNNPQQALLSGQLFTLGLRYNF